MALRVDILVAHAVASQHAAANAELQVFAAVTTAALVWTQWSVAPQKLQTVKNDLRAVAMDNGITKEDWEDKVAAVFRAVTNLSTHMAKDPLLLAVRDANDEGAALGAMLDLFTVKGVTCRHYFKQWSKQANCDKFDPNALKAARDAKEAAARAVRLAMCSSIDASSEAAREAAAKVQSDALAAAAAMTPLQVFALDVAGISDASMIDAMFAVLNARAAELRAIAAAASDTMPAASEPAVSRGKRAKARREAAAA